MRKYEFDCDHNLLGEAVQAIQGAVDPDEQGHLRIVLNGPAGGNPFLELTTDAPWQRIRRVLRSLLDSGGMADDDMWSEPPS